MERKRVMGIMIMWVGLTVLIMTGSLLSATVYAATFYVAPKGNDARSCEEARSVDHPRQTLGAGLACLTMPGDTLRLREGTYPERILIDHESTHILRGTSWDVPITIAASEGETVILQPGAGGPVIHLTHPDVQYVVFEGLTVNATEATHGVYLGGDVHHVRFHKGAIRQATRHAIETSYAQSRDYPPTAHEFLDLILHDNGTQPHRDATVVLGTSQNLVQQVQLAENVGGGIVIRKSDAHHGPDRNILQFNVISSGQGDLDRWGIHVEDGTRTVVYTNLLSGYLQGILVEGPKTSSSWVVHNTMVGLGEIGVRVKQAEAVAGVHNNIAYGFAEGVDAPNAATDLVAGNLVRPPHFVAEGRGDFHLQPTSPAIDTGLDLTAQLAEILPGKVTDYEGRPRPSGQGWDMGAYEYPGEKLAPPVAAFSASATTGAAPLLTSFVDASVGEITSWLWDFGDGSMSQDRHPSHQYVDSGAYTVGLIVSGPGGSHTVSVPQMIVVNASLPWVDFTATPVTGTVPVDIAFTNTSQQDAATEWVWDFGDGTTSTARAPIHRFTTPGTFTVQLSGDGPLGSDAEIKAAYLSLRPALGLSLLEESFDSGFFDAWQVVDEGSWQSPSSWLVLTGSLAQVSNIWSPPADPAEIAKLGTYVWYPAGADWRNYLVHVTLRSDDNDALGIMVRYQDQDNYYRFSWDQEGGYRRLVKKVEGVFTLLAEEAVPYVQGEAYAIEILAYDDTLDVHVNGASIFGGSVRDASLTQGSVGLYSWFNNKSVFDDVLVTAVDTHQSQ